MVKRVCPGNGISYGLRHTFDRPTTVATVPLGYADGVPRRLFPAGGQVLIGGRRRTIVGVVTMDQVMVNCADDEVSIGDDVVLIGAQGDEHVTAPRVGDAPGHDRLRDHLRDLAAHSTDLPGHPALTAP